MENEKQLQTRPNNFASKYKPKVETPVDPRQIKKKAFQYTTADIYRPFGAKKDAYSVAMYRAWANEARINFEMLKFEKTDEYVEVWGRAWVSQPGHADYMERGASIKLIYKDLLRDAILSAITNGVSYSYVSEGRNQKKYINAPIAWEMDENGFPKITNPEAMMAILKEHVKKRNILERIARANVEKIVFSEILNNEDPSEPESGEEGSDQEHQDEAADQERGGDYPQETRETGAAISQEDQDGKILDALLDKIIEKAKVSAGDNSAAAKELFGAACEKILGKRIRVDDIHEIEVARNILAAIPNDVIEKEQLTTGDALAVLGGTVEGEIPGADKKHLNLQSPPQEKYDPIQAQRDMAALEISQVQKEFNNSFEKALAYFMDKIGLPVDTHLEDLATEKQLEKILQAIIDYHLGN